MVGEGEGGFGKVSEVRPKNVDVSVHVGACCSRWFGWWCLLGLFKETAGYMSVSVMHFEEVRSALWIESIFGLRN